jgi:hypothetical protein
MSSPSSLLRRALHPSVSVLLLALAPSPRLHAMEPLHLALDGVLGERCVLGAPEQPRPTIVFFMGPRAQAESAAFGRTVDEVTLAADVETIAVADVQRYGGWLRSMATSRLRKAAADALSRRRTRRQAHGAVAREDVVARWHLVADFDGSLFTRFAVAANPQHPLAFVVDRRGNVQGPYRDAAGVVAALAKVPCP